MPCTIVRLNRLTNASAEMPSKTQTIIPLERSFKNVGRFDLKSK